MSSTNPKWAPEPGLPIQREPEDRSASSPTFLPTNKEEIEPQELLSLIDFFLLLDEWDRQRQR
jgi:hypothetical protein